MWFIVLSLGWGLIKTKIWFIYLLSAFSFLHKSTSPQIQSYFITNISWELIIKSNGKKPSTYFWRSFLITNTFLITKTKLYDGSLSHFITFHKKPLAPKNPPTTCSNVTEWNKTKRERRSRTLFIPCARKFTYWENKVLFKNKL